MKTRRKVLLTLFVENSVSDKELLAYLLKTVEESSWARHTGHVAKGKTSATVFPVGGKIVQPYHKKRDFTFTETYMGTANEKRGMSRQRDRRK